MAREPAKAHRENATRARRAESEEIAVASRVVCRGTFAAPRMNMMMDGAAAAAVVQFEGKIFNMCLRVQRVSARRLSMARGGSSRLALGAS